MTKPVDNRLKKYTKTDPAFVMEVIQFSLDKYHKGTKNTATVSPKRVFKLLSILDVISTEEMKKLMPDVGERTVRLNTAACRSCIKVVS